MEHQSDELEIDLLDLFLYLKKKWVIICAVFVVCAIAGFLFSSLFIPSEYTASTRIYVLNRQNENNVVTSDYQIANYMISDYTVLITGRNVTSQVISTLGLNMGHAELSEMIEVTSPDNTRVLQISVTDTDAKRAATLANSVREIASAQIKEIMDVDAVNLVYVAETPQEPSGPSVMKYTVLAAALGLVAVVGVYVVIYLLDDTIRTEEDVEKYLGLGTLGVIPVSNEFDAMQGKGGAKKSFTKADAGKKK